MDLASSSSSIEATSQDVLVAAISENGQSMLLLLYILLDRKM